jgi:hypothetical protein
MTPEEHKRLSVFYTHTELNTTTFTEPVLVLWYPDVKKYGVTSFPKQYVGKIFKYVYVARGVPNDVYKKYWAIYVFRKGLKLPYSFKRQEDAEAFAEKLTYPSNSYYYMIDGISSFVQDVMEEWCIERNIQWKDRFFQ